MKRFFELGNQFAQQSTWKDFALTKFCLCAMGVLIGVLLPDTVKTAAAIIAAIIFIITYIPLMVKVFKIFRKMPRK